MQSTALGFLGEGGIVMNDLLKAVDELSGLYTEQKQDVERAYALIRQTQEQNNHAYKKLFDLQEVIKNGATTGDRLMDWVITHSDDPRRTYDMLNGLTAQLANNIGALVLVVASGQYHWCKDNNSPNDVDCVRMGIISSDESLFYRPYPASENDTLGVPTLQHVFWCPQCENRHDTKANGGIGMIEKGRIPIYNWEYYGTCLSQMRVHSTDRSPGCWPEKKFKIVVGDNEVANWFQSHSEHYLRHYRNAFPVMLSYLKHTMIC